MFHQVADVEPLTPSPGHSPHKACEMSQQYFYKGAYYECWVSWQWYCIKGKQLISTLIISNYLSCLSAIYYASTDLTYLVENHPPPPPHTHKIPQKSPKKQQHCFRHLFIIHYVNILQKILPLLSSWNYSSQTIVRAMSCWHWLLTFLTLPGWHYHIDTTLPTLHY